MEKSMRIRQAMALDEIEAFVEGLRKPTEEAIRKSTHYKNGLVYRYTTCRGTRRRSEMVQSAHPFAVRHDW